MRLGNSLRSMRRAVEQAAAFEPPPWMAIGAWAAIAALFYLPFAIPGWAYVQVDDLLNSELVYSVAIGGLWRGDPSVASSFLNGNVPVLALARLTQPLSGLYAVLEPLAAFVTTDVIVRSVAAAGTYLLLRQIGTPRLFAHLAALIYALNVANTTFLLSVAGLPAATYLLLIRPRALNYLVLCFIGSNTSIYLSGLFYLVVAPVLYRFVFRRGLDRAFLFGLGAFAIGLIIGNAGLLWLASTSGIEWHREEWGPWSTLKFPISYPELGKLLIIMFCAAAYACLRAQRDTRGRRLLIVAAGIVAWYLLIRLPAVQLWQRDLPFPLGQLNVDRAYFLWPFLVVLLTGLAAAAQRANKSLLLLAILVQFPIILVQHQHIRQPIRFVLGKDESHTHLQEYYAFEWFNRRPLGRDMVLLSVGLDPMIAPINGVRSIDGYFPLYPLNYKHRFRRVIEKSLEPSGRTRLYDQWGSQVYAYHPPDRPELIDFCAARDLGANHVLSAYPINSLDLGRVLHDRWYLYRIDCEQPHASHIARPDRLNRPRRATKSPGVLSAVQSPGGAKHAEIAK